MSISFCDNGTFMTKPLCDLDRRVTKVDAFYGYPNCNHVFENGRCVLCYWDGNKSDYLKNKD